MWKNKETGEELDSITEEQKASGQFELITDLGSTDEQAHYDTPVPSGVKDLKETGEEKAPENTEPVPTKKLQDISLEELTREDLERSEPEEILNYVDNHKLKIGTLSVEKGLIDYVMEKQVDSSDLHQGPGPVEKEDEPTLLEKVIDTRLIIDSTMQMTKIRHHAGNPIVKSLFKAKAWLGKLLEQLDTKNPYEVEGGVKDKSQIPPTADVSKNENVLRKFALEDDLDKILILRAGIDQCVLKIEAIKFGAEDVKDIRLASIAKTEAYVNLCEARFELGNELAILRDS